MIIKTRLTIPNGKLCNAPNQADKGCRFKKFLELGNDYCLIYRSYLKSKTGEHDYNASYYKCNECLKNGM